MPCPVAVLGACLRFLTKRVGCPSKAVLTSASNEVIMARLEKGRRSLRPKALVRRGCAVLPSGPLTALRRKIHFAPVFSQMKPFLSMLVLAVLTCLCVPAFSQTDVNDVHIQPREVEKKPDPPKEDKFVSVDG